LSGGDCIAIDWGTTNRRVYRLDAGGVVVDGFQDARGVLAMERDAFPGEIAAIRERWGQLPVIASGMVGSNRGWREAPYCDVPANLPTLAAGVVQLEDHVTLVPGLAQRIEHATDVMRGEEILVFGACSGELAPESGLFCQPGTHNKWIEVQDRCITGFRTAMTGELFALLKSQSILASMLDGKVCANAAFIEGVERGAGSADLPVALFRTRAGVLLDMRDAEGAASYVSGVLIGSDIGAGSDIAERDVYLVSSGPLGDLYVAAIEWAGGTVHRVDAEAAFCAGIHALRKVLP